MKEIPLTQSKVAIVDDEDYELVSQFKWFAWRHRHGDDLWYAHVTLKSRKTLRMHRLILNAPDGIEVDHKDGNGLNNRRSNIRLATTSQNQGNRKVHPNSASGYRGARIDSTNGRRTGLWKAAVRCLGKDYLLGTFANPQEAALAYDAKAKELFGEFAWLNFPEGEQP